MKRTTTFIFVGLVVGASALALGVAAQGGQDTDRHIASWFQGRGAAADHVPDGLFGGPGGMHGFRGLHGAGHGHGDHGGQGNGTHDHGGHGGHHASHGGRAMMEACLQHSNETTCETYMDEHREAHRDMHASNCAATHGGSQRAAHRPDRDPEPTR